MNDVIASTNGGGPSGVPPHLESTYALLRQLTILDGIPNDALRVAVESGGIELQRHARDSFVADPGTTAADSRIVFVIQGQVSAGVFDAHELADRRAEQLRQQQMSAEELRELSKLKPKPLARLAKKNLALFQEGDLFNSVALASSAAPTFRDGPTQPVAFFTAAPSVLALVSHGTIADLASSFPFFEARIRRAIQVSRDRLHNITGVKQEILDFFLRHGISVSGEIVRIRQLDRCIDCKQCEEACEERYGARRLTLGGYQLGMLDFVFTCRTCTDQRCIDPCEYDSIIYDPERGEVEINEASCTGCTLCAQSCPYDAIEMVDVEDQANPTYREAFKIRLEADGSLAFGSGKPRVARARRIANKCDHCVNYRDQACISACPTGSLIELPARDLFRERPAAAAVLAKAGYDQDLPPVRSELLPTEPFTEGIGVRNGGEAKMRRGKWGPVILWGLALGAFFLALAEIALRTWFPKSSLRYLMLRNDDYPIAIALDKTAFTPGTDLAIWCGFIGTALMAISAAYPIWRRVPVFRYIASNSMWFDFHMMAGIVGPMFVLLHSAFQFDDPVPSGAFWSMVIVVISGVIGRYLYTQVPDLMNGRDLEDLDNERAFVRLRNANALAAAECQREIEEHARGAAIAGDRPGMLRALGWIMLEDLKRPFRWWRRRGRLKKSGAVRSLRKELARRTGRQLIIQRRRVLAPRAELLLNSWKKVHVPFTVVLVLIGALHIWSAWKYV